MITALLLSHHCESVSLGKLASEWIYPLCESDTQDEQEEWTAGPFSHSKKSDSESLWMWNIVLFVSFVTCRIHSESSKALRKESSESDGVALGAQALSSFLRAAFTCRVSANSTGTSSQLREESTLRPCQDRETAVSDTEENKITLNEIDYNLHSMSPQTTQFTGSIFISMVGFFSRTLWCHKEKDLWPFSFKMLAPHHLWCPSDLWPLNSYHLIPESKCMFVPNLRKFPWCYWYITFK